MESTDQPFDILRRTLTLLTTGPGQPTLPTASVKGVDAAELTASQVLERLRKGPQNQTDELWHRVFAHARAGESTWTVIAAGAMLGPMVTACARYARVPAHQIPDVEGELLTALLEQVRSIPAGVIDVQHRLWSAVTNTANRYCYRQVREASALAAGDQSMVAVARRSGRGPVTVLAEAVSARAVTPVEADLVARTRLEGAPLRQVAQDLRLSYITARRWRKAAEERLASLLVTDESEVAMSDIGT
ncbi:hypothetical protein [Nocardiopsis sp. NPDC006938]|uniref:hypothetical protein n=1 Tax=Nocardiopsis sp. NPDC006938 TaxID=3364337 RepID=UPI0036BF9D1A